MKSKLIYIAVALCMILALLPAVLSAPSAQAAGTTWYVGPTGNFTAIQEAIDNTSVLAGDTIIVNDGTYTEAISISKALTIRSANGSASTTIDGGSDIAVRIETSDVTFGGDGHGFAVQGTDVGIVIGSDVNGSTTSGVTVQGNEITVTGDVAVAILMVAANNSACGNNIINNSLPSSCDYGIALVNQQPAGTTSNLSDNHITGNTISSADFGIWLGADPVMGWENGIISRNIISGNTINNSVYGIIMTSNNGSAYNNTISGNTINNASLGITIVNNNGSVYNNTITGNTLRDCGVGVGSAIAGGITITNSAASGDMHDNTVENNTISDCSRGIKFIITSMGSEDCSVTHNTIQGNTIINSSYDGIDLINCGYGDMSDNTISGNTINGSSNSSYGIQLVNTENASMDGNTVEGNNVSYCVYGGIYLNMTSSAGMNGNTIEDNNLSYCDGHAEGEAGILISSTGSADSSVAHNTIHGNNVSSGNVGIELFSYLNGNITDSTISGNTVYNCSEYGIYLYNPGDGDMDDNTVESNNVSYCIMDGIYLNMAGSSSMDGNTVQHNNLSYCDQPGAASIYMVSAGGASSSVSRNTIHGNTIANSNYNGILLYCRSSASINDSIISGNTIYNFSEYGIWLYNSGNDVSNNSVDGNNVSDGIGTGIYLYNYNNMGDNSVDGNTVYNCSDYGIYLDNSGNDVSNNSVDGNNVSDCTNGIYLENYGYGISYISVDGNNVSDCVYGIWLENDADDYDISYSSVDRNNVYNCSDTGIYLLNYGDDMYNNSIVGNTVYNCSAYGIDLYNVYDEGDDMYNNSVDGNNVSACSDGIYLGNEGDDMYGNSVDGNTVYDCDDDGIYLENYVYMYDNSVSGNTIYNCDNDGIYLYNDGDEMYDNSITGNTIYDCDDDGIYLENYGDGDEMYDNSIEGNTVHDCFENGIYLSTDDGSEYTYDNSIVGNNVHDCDEGLHVEYCSDTLILSNRIHDNMEGIHAYGLDYVNIYGNDIRDNVGGTDTGIYLYDTDGYINCNNIVGNQPYGIDDDSGESGENHVDIGNNWWGDPGGPDADDNDDGIYGDSVHNNGGLSGEDVLETEYTPLSDSIVNTASERSTISLYDAFYQYYEYEQYQYTLGPAYTWLILETTIPYCEECAPSYATLNLSAMLLDMLPANFSETVSNWSPDTQDTWYSWLYNLSDIFMSGYSDGGTAFWDYPVYLENILFDTGDPVGGHCLYEFFDIEEDWSAFDTLMSEELRLGQFEIPVTLTKEWPISYAEALSAEPGPLGFPAEEYYSETVSTFIPLNIVDFLLPLARGWNVRSTPATLDDKYNTLGDIINLSGGLPGLEQVLTWNASSGQWEEPGMNTVLTPLEAYFIKVNNNDQMGFILSRNASDTPERRLYAGWNVVGPAPNFSYYNESLTRTYPFPLMLVQDALASVAGNASVRGWDIAMNMPEDLSYTEHFYYKSIALQEASYDKYFYQEPWTAIYNNRWNTESPYVTPGGGYWVFMKNPYTLLGNSTTPVPDWLFEDLIPD